MTRLAMVSPRLSLKLACALSRPCCRSISTASSQTVLRIPKCDVFRFGDSNRAPPLFRELEWTMQDGEAWAVVGSAGNEKNALLELLLGHHRVYPSVPGGIFPFIPPNEDPQDCVSHVSFSARPKAGGGGFYDYSARYGAVREEDRITLRQSLSFEGTESELDIMAERLDLKRLLSLPLVALSNGQTRRARILKELLKHPKLLLLEEPFTGLDVFHRPQLAKLIEELHVRRTPRIVMALRNQDPIPDWVSHLAVVQGDRVETGKKEVLRPGIPSFASQHVSPYKPKSPEDPKSASSGVELVSLKGVNIAYHERKVLSDINWTIRAGDRWHLQGPNGSGKTTLLALITGDHPQSYIQQHLLLFSQPRRRLATTQLQQKIGIVSPEIYNAFPRRSGAQGLTVREAIATGFESTFSYRPRTAAQDARIDELLQKLGPGSPNFDKQIFAVLSPGEQSLVLLLRGLVNRPPLLVLDEVFAGMDEDMIQRAKKYLREEIGSDQAVVFVTHWEEEVPWPESEVKRFVLGNTEP